MRRRAATRTVLLVLLVAVILCVALPSALSAQTTNSRVLHLWVDPVHGNDAQALASNPIASSLICGSTVAIGAPSDVVDTAGKPLLHASYPFLTIKAAVAYVPPLPYTGPSGYEWLYAIVHLLPGRYAKDAANKPYRDNNQYGNGEVFPIDIPDRVSIQGASALNTVIDLSAWQNLRRGPAFRFGEQANSTGKHSFISSVAFHGALESDPDFKEHAAAIYIADKYASAPTIVNCVFYGNQVGILVRSGALITQPESNVTHDGTTIMNNTFAWNICGIWNGYWPLPADATHVWGDSKLIVVNNLFDASGSYANCPMPADWLAYGAVPGARSFEGLDGNDMTIAPPTGGGTLPWGGNFNAYEPNTNATGTFPNMFNTGTMLPGSSLPPTLPRSGTPGNPTGNVPNPPGAMDIGPVTGGSQRFNVIVGGKTFNRGILFIRDLICNGKAASQFKNGLGFTLHDGSPHDFRLSPAQLDAWEILDPPAPRRGPGEINTSTGSTYGKANQLIDAGWWGIFPAPMNNGLSLQRPGALPLGTGNATWAYDAMLYDMEGYGNPRVWNHPLVPDTGLNLIAQLAIDIGADECGSLILTGFRYATTNYYSIPQANVHPSGRGHDQKYVWRIGLPTSMFPTGFTLKNVKTPAYRTNLSGMAAGASWTGTWWYVDPAAPSTFQPPGPLTYYIPFLVDVTPHLPPDYHPWHQYPLGGMPSFPVWKPCATGGYNVFLYENPLANVINPPGSFIPLPLTASTFNWLDGLGATVATAPDFMWFSPPPVGHSNSPVATGPLQYTQYDEWCRGWDVNNPGPKFATLRSTFTPDTAQPLRYTVERYTLENHVDTPWEAGLLGSNIQSFRICVAGGQ